MFFEAAPAVDVEITKAVVAGLATIIVAGLSLLGIMYQARKPSKTKPPVGETGPALETFNGTQNEFMALVVADNKDLRQQMGELKTIVTEVKEHQENFLGAVRRYLMKLASAWGQPGPMPWPDDNDFHILEDTLPNRGGTITRRDQ